MPTRVCSEPVSCKRESPRDGWDGILTFTAPETSFTDAWITGAPTKLRKMTIPEEANAHPGPAAQRHGPASSSANVGAVFNPSPIIREPKPGADEWRSSEREGERENSVAKESMKAKNR